MTDKKNRKVLKSIKSSVLSRGVSLTKLAVKSGTRLATAKMKGAAAGKLDDVLKLNALSIVEELGKLKGSAMKLGQSFAMMSEHFFPGEVAQILGRLNDQSQAVAWETMAEALKVALPAEALAELDIEEDAFASASLGQVHKAVVKATGEQLCMKIQYPGVCDSIDSDLATIKALFKVSKIIPNYSERLDDIFSEIKTMLKQETDYRQEAQNLEDFRRFVADDPRYIVPQFYPRYSSQRVLTTSFEAGDSINDEVIAQLPRNRRRALARNYAELFLRELLIYNKIQTDPHYGNYKVRLDAAGQDRLILLDFGAMRGFSQAFLKPYRELIRGAINRDRQQVLQASEALDFIRGDDSATLKDQYVALCYLVVEPWVTVDTPDAHPDYFGAQGYYDWCESDLPQRLKVAIARLSLAFKLRPPPQEVIFLDRRLAGVFTTLKCLDAPFDAHELIMSISA